jgi:hypothetical protein
MLDLVSNFTLHFILFVGFLLEILVQRRLILLFVPSLRLAVFIFTFAGVHLLGLLVLTAYRPPDFHMLHLLQLFHIFFIMFVLHGRILLDKFLLSYWSGFDYAHTR